MTFLQALRYFMVEAALSLLRSWKVSVLAVLTISVSLFVGGLFLWLSNNLSAWIGEWQEEARVLVYLEPDAPEETIEEIRRRARDTPWTIATEEISADQAKERFQRIFPSLQELVDGWDRNPLPASIEINYHAEAAGLEGFERWLEKLRGSPAVTMVDDDRDWLRRLESILGLLRVTGLCLGAILLTASMFTIASVIRLTAYLYRDEISIMRLVGATEFFIRGPLYMEGLIQGLVGGALAAGGLYGAHHLLLGGGRSYLASLLPLHFLTPPQIAALVLLGGVAGLVGATASLHRETLKVSED